MAADWGKSSATKMTIRLDDAPYLVVGVMPRGFAFPDADDRLWTPIALTPQQLANHGSHFLRVVARLKQGVTIEQLLAMSEDDIGQRADCHGCAALECLRHMPDFLKPR